MRILIVNWNSKEDTLACIRSLLTSGAQPEEILVVDNGSQDGSVRAMHETFGVKLQVLENHENLGYAPAVNQGVQILLDQDADWILLLNNDTLVAPDFLPRLEAASLAQPDSLIFGPLIYYHDDPENIWYLGDRLIPGTLLTTNPYRGKPYDSRLPLYLPVDFVSGCAMLIHRRVFRKVGLFDAGLVMYGEEIDFLWRARQAGFFPVAVTQAWMWHKVSASAARTPPRTRYLKIRNQARFYRRYSRGLQRPVHFLFTLLRTLAIAAAGVFTGQAAQIGPALTGWIDGWFGQLDYNKPLAGLQK